MKFLLASIFLMTAFIQPKQGIEGFLREVKGNQMGIQKQSSTKGKPFTSKLYVFKKLSNEDLVGLDGQWCQSLKQKPYKIIPTDKTGYFKCRLATGKYVVLIGAYGGYFIPSFNQYNQPSIIEVKSGKWEQMHLLVNSRAIY